MSLLREFGQAVAEQRATLANPADWMYQAFGAGRTDAGVEVNEWTAQNFAAVFACVDFIAGVIGMLPVDLYQRTEVRGHEDKKLAVDHPAFTLVRDEPNPDMTHITMFETGAAHKLLWGNHFAEIVRNASGEPIALWPLLPERTRIVRKNRQTRVITRTTMGGVQQQVILRPGQYLHVPNLSHNGLTGISTVRQMSQDIGVGLAADTTAASMLAHGPRFSGVINYDGTFRNSAARRRFQAQFDDAHGGSRNAGRTPVLAKGMEWVKTGMSPQDTQLLEMRQYAVKIIAMSFGVPPHLLGFAESGGSARASLEVQSREWVQFKLMRRLVKWEQALSRALIRPEDRREFFIEWNVDGLLRGDFKTRMEGVQVLRQWGMASINEMRARERMSPIDEDWADDMMVQVNMKPAAELSLVQGPRGGDLGGSDDDRQLDDDQRRELEIVEERQDRSIDARVQQQRIHEALLESAAERWQRRELDQLRKQVRRADRGELEQWMASFYADHADTVARHAVPFVAALGEAVYDLAAEEVAGDGNYEDDAEAMVLAGEYSSTLGEREASGALAQLRKLLEDHRDDDEMFEAVTTRADEWETTRPGKVARRNVVQIGGAFAALAWRTAGVVRKVWRNTGSENCPLCTTLEGRTVSIEAPFVKRGETVDPKDDETTPLKAWTNYGHPPLHQGCDCSISPG